MGANSIVSGIGKYEGYGFRLGAVSGVVAAGLAASSDLFAFRNILSPRKIRILEVRVSAANAGTAFAAGIGSFNMFAARGFSVSDTGGTSIVMAAGGNTNKLRTAQVSSNLQGTNGDLRIASTGALGAGTRVLDVNAVGAIVFGVQATAGQQLVSDTPLYEASLSSYVLPLVLDQNEGFVIQGTVPATGNFVFGVQVLWAEIDGGGGLRS